MVMVGKKDESMDDEPGGGLRPSEDAEDNVVQGRARPEQESPLKGPIGDLVETTWFNMTKLATHTPLDGKPEEGIDILPESGGTSKGAAPQKGRTSKGAPPQKGAPQKGGSRPWHLKAAVTLMAPCEA